MTNAGILSELNSGFLDSTRLLFDLQQGNDIAQSLSGCLEPETIARCVTEGLVEKFGCAFARVWLVEPDRTALKLVASSGMYTRLDGSFARVPMGAFKVGKIAQHCIPFLSNHLADESWVKDREWAIAHNIRGFAGYPLAISGRVVGVLATFSRQPMAAEFLEVLQSLCTTVTVALENALRYQQERQTWHAASSNASGNLSGAPLSEQLASILSNVRLILVGTERVLAAATACVFLRAAEALGEMKSTYCRLTYGEQQITLEAMISSSATIAQAQQDDMASAFGDAMFAAACLGGSLHQTTTRPGMMQVLLTLPYPSCAVGSRLHVRCQQPVLQMAFTHLAYLAGLTVCPTANDGVPTLTDNPAIVETASPIMWVATSAQSLCKDAKARIDLSISPSQLREAVETVAQGKFWGIVPPDTLPCLSDREQQIMTLLAQGWRDRDIAHQLIISESTVKFHVNNTLAKLKAKTRYQALYRVITNGWVQ